MNQKLVSVCIPTWNRAAKLKKTLDSILQQVLVFRDKVEICVSDNASTDNTREIIMKFKEKYPNLIKYNENKKNLGYDKNLLKVISMAEGKFIWTFGDHYFIIDGGLKKVIKCVENIDDENVGIIGVRHESIIVDEKQPEKVLLSFTGVYKDKPGLFVLNAADTIKNTRLGIVCGLIFNNKIIKKLFKENTELIKNGVGHLFMHLWLCYLMCVLNNNMKCCMLNEAITTARSGYCKPIIEDHFKLKYAGYIGFYNEMESVSRDVGKYAIARIFNRKKRRAKMGFIFNMMLFKIFGVFTPLSYFRCVQLFFSHLGFVDAVMFSFCFLIISITPAFILRKTCKVFLKIIYDKRAESIWENRSKIYSMMRGSERRMEYFKDGCTK